MGNEISGKDSASSASETVLEQYKIAVDMWDRVKARRQLANTFFLSINTAVIAASEKGYISKGSLVLSFSGIMLCALWIVAIINYKTLTDIKSVVINNMEKLLPLSPFTEEAKRPRFTIVEIIVAAVFMLLHASLLVT